MIGHKVQSPLPAPPESGAGKYGTFPVWTVSITHLRRVGLQVQDLKFKIKKAKLEKVKWMYRRIALFFCTCCMMLPLSAQTADGDAARPIVRSTMYGVGKVNLYDTYLSPLEYEGTQFRILRESTRMMRWMDGNISRQTLFQGHVGIAHNPTETADELTGMVNWNYAFHYNWSLLGGQLRLSAGPMMLIHGGFTYNTRNGNNPAQARLYANLAASGMIRYHLPWKTCPLTFRYQMDVPLLGVMFSPQYGQSYYEIFSLGHADGVVHFTSLHNQPTLRHWLTADMRFRKFTLRLGYMADMQQSKVNGLRAHDYSHSFMIGLVHELVNK